MGTVKVVARRPGAAGDNHATRWPEDDISSEEIGDKNAHHFQTKEAYTENQIWRIIPSQCLVPSSGQGRDPESRARST